MGRIRVIAVARMQAVQYELLLVVRGEAADGQPLLTLQHPGRGLLRGALPGSHRYWLYLKKIKKKTL